MYIDLAPLIASFTVILLAELGDKTHICTMILASKSSFISVFSGAMLAFFIVDGLSAFLGGSILSILPKPVIGIVAGLTFIIFGLLSLRSSNDSSCEFNDVKASFLKTFTLISLMELGDKTQLSSILLAASFNNPTLVLIGVMLAFSIITGLSVIVGSKILRFIPMRYLRILSSIIFIILGLVMISQTLPL
ncbi:TMEM165/GDT1 family protein [Candidatus Culexarchaeum yellowstonense]|uniref:TMEM165/GDT1 family protein n=1 Tax=Candidatus Culexarchaeum yellowstonense TaxID=2928963 RepID=UPI0034E96AD2